MPDTPLLVLIGIVVVALSVLSIWQYGVALRRQGGQQDVADAQQAQVAALLARQEALVTRAEALVRLLEVRTGVGAPEAEPGAAADTRG